MSHEKVLEALRGVSSCGRDLATLPEQHGFNRDPESVPGQYALALMDDFWLHWGDAQHALDTIPPAALADLTALADGKLWDLTVRRILDELVERIIDTRHWFDPRAAEEPETQFDTARRMTAELRYRVQAAETYGGEPTVATMLYVHPAFASWHVYDSIFPYWQGLLADLDQLILDFQSIRGKRYDAQPDNAQPAGAGPIPDVLRERAEEALLRALGFQFNGHVRESSVALQGALAAEDEATVQAAWQALTQALPREGGPASLDELQERWATAGRDVAGIDWATAHLRGVATGLQAVGTGQDTAGRKKGTVNARMLELVQRDLARVGGWTAEQWAKELRCSPPAVVATPTWKDLAMARERQKAERKTDRRRRKRAAKRD